MRQGFAFQRTKTPIRFRCIHRGDHSLQGNGNWSPAISWCAAGGHHDCSPGTTRTDPSLRGGTQRTCWHTADIWNETTEWINQKKMTYLSSQMQHRSWNIRVPMRANVITDGQGVGRPRFKSLTQPWSFSQSRSLILTYLVAWIKWCMAMCERNMQASLSSLEQR